MNKKSLPIDNPRRADINDIGYIYVIKVILMKSIRGGTRVWYKIGKTINPRQRLLQYNGSFPEDKYDYMFVSEKIYNLSNVENMLISQIQSKNKFIFSESRREWFYKKGNQRAFQPGSYLPNIINKMVDIYYEN